MCSRVEQFLKRKASRNYLWSDTASVTLVHSKLLEDNQGRCEHREDPTYSSKPSRSATVHSPYLRPPIHASTFDVTE